MRNTVQIRGTNAVTGLIAIALALPVVSAWNRPALWESLGSAWGLIGPGQWYYSNHYAGHFFDAFILFLIMWPLIYGIAHRNAKLPKATAAGLALMLWLPLVFYFERTGTLLFNNFWIGFLSAIILTAVLTKFLYALAVSLSRSRQWIALFVAACIALALTGLLVNDFLHNLPTTSPAENNAKETLTAGFDGAPGFAMLGIIVGLITRKRRPSDRELSNVGRASKGILGETAGLEGQGLTQDTTQAEATEEQEIAVAEAESKEAKDEEQAIDEHIKGLLDTAGTIAYKLQNIIKLFEQEVSPAQTEQIGEELGRMNDVINHFREEASVLAPFLQKELGDLRDMHLISIKGTDARIAKNAERVKTYAEDAEEQLKRLELATGKLEDNTKTLNQLKEIGLSSTITRVNTVARALAQLTQQAEQNRKTLDERLTLLQQQIASAKARERVLERIANEQQQSIEQAVNYFQNKIQERLQTVGTAFAAAATEKTKDNLLHAETEITHLINDLNIQYNNATKRKTNFATIDEELQTINQHLSHEKQVMEEVLAETRTLAIQDAEVSELSASLNEFLQGIESIHAAFKELTNAEGGAKAKNTAYKLIRQSLRELRKKEMEAVAEEEATERMSRVKNPALQAAAKQALLATKELEQQIPAKVQQLEQQQARLQQTAAAFTGGKV